MGMRLRTTTILASAVASLAVLAACGTGAEEPVESGTPVPLGPDRWMEDVFADAADVTLGEMVLPGTHDSGSFAIDVEGPCDIVPAAGTPGVITALSSTNPCAAAGMYRAQDETLAEQLQAGIRYLDLRVSVPEAGALPLTASAGTGTSGASPAPTATPDGAATGFVLEHEFVSVPLTDALDEILTFAADHPKEQVILDFQHIDLPDDADTAAFYSALSQVLTSYAPAGAAPVCERAWASDVVDATPATLATDVTLADAWAADRNLVVLVPDQTLPANPCYYPRSQAILSQWPNTEDPATSVSFNADQLTERATRLAASPPNCSNGGTNPSQGDNWCGFFVSQMQLTFQPATFARCIADTTLTCSLFDYSQKVNNAVGPQVQSWAVGAGLPVNIVIVDYYNVSTPEYTESLIDVNRQLLVQRSDASAGASASADASS